MEEKPIKVTAHNHKDDKYARAYEEYINQPEVLEAIDKEVAKKIANFLTWGPNGRPNKDSREAPE